MRGSLRKSGCFLPVIDEIKTIHVIKSGLRSLEEAYNYGRDFILENDLCEISFNISESPRDLAIIPPRYEVQIEGVVKSGEPDQVSS